MAFPGSVTADIETPNAVGSGDVVDDPAFLIHPTDPLQSVIITTNKSFGAGEGGLYVYDLTGALVETEGTGLSANALNNVDVRYNFGGYDNVIGATSRESATIEFFTYDFTNTTDELTNIGTIPTSFTPPNTEPYGFTMGRDGIKYYAFASCNIGSEVKQWELSESGGVISGTLVRTLVLPSQVEGMVVDDQNGTVYIGAEDVAIRKYDTDPTTTSFTTVDTVSGGNLSADIEGLAIYHGATAADGYLIASSQGDSKYCVYQRGGSNAFVGKFDIVAGATIDGTTVTDGLDVTNVNLGGPFDKGAFIVHDGLNTPTTESNFKVVGFGKIATLGGLATSTSYDPRAPLSAPAAPTVGANYVNLLRPGGTWITGGPGTVTIDANSGQITIVPDGTGLVYARRGVATQVNRTYQLTWSNDSSSIMIRQIGTAQGLADIRAAANSVNGDNKIEFTATTTTTWISFQRTSVNSVTVSNPILQEVPAGASSARRLNGKNQFFSLDAQASGLRMTNANWFIGGWLALTWMPASTFYLMDFGRTDPAATSGGAGRMRLFYDVDATKLACSTAESAGTNYRENYLIAPLQLDTWYYIGMTALANADVLVNLGTARGASYIGTTLPPVSVSEICRVLQFGARTISPRTSFSPARYSNWIWASNWIPNTTQINMLASGEPVGEVTGLTAPGGASLYHWPMVGTASEPSLVTTTAPLVSNSSYGSIITVPGPVLATDAAVVPVSSQMDVIIT